jgi:hypothetical protein
MKRTLCVSLSILLLTASASLAQQSVTIQLPSQQVFSVSTTVSVPDRGSAYLGGISRASSGSISRGVPGLSKLPGANRLFNNRGIGTSRGASNVHVTATIIDLHEMDEMILGEAAARRAASGGEALAAQQAAVHRQASFLSQHVGRPAVPLAAEPAAPRVVTLQETPQQIAQTQAQREAEAESLLEGGRKAEAEGKIKVACIYYKMAARQLPAERRDQIMAYVEALRRSESERVASRP